MLRQHKNARLALEPMAEQTAAGRHNPGLNLHWMQGRGDTTKHYYHYRAYVGIGSYDEREVFYDPGEERLYLVARNSGLGYVSLYVFCLDSRKNDITGEEIGKGGQYATRCNTLPLVEVYEQSGDWREENPGWDSWSMKKLCKKLLEQVQD